MADRRPPTLAQRAAGDGVEAFGRLTLARKLRDAGQDFMLLRQPANAQLCRRLARNLDAQRRRLMAPKKPPRE